MGQKKSKSSSEGRPFISGDRDETIVDIRLCACRIMHGSVSWVATGITNILTLGQSPPVEHRWLEIQTDRAWYCVQQYQCGSQCMNKVESQRRVTLMGFDCANKPYDSDAWTVNSWSRSDLTKHTLGDVQDFIENEHFGWYYDMMTHNCQHFCRALMDYLT